MFDAVKVHGEIVQWIRDYMKENGPNSPILVGISGGKDSTITAALCVEAVGKERVIGVLMPNHFSDDIPISQEICNYLGIKRVVYDIGPVIKAQFEQMKLLPFKDFKKFTDFTNNNNPPRIRMATLYLLATQIGARVANTCNMSETYVGYDTKWGDQCGDFAPIQNLTVTELRQLGDVMGLPKKFVYKTPTDGLCGQTDEDRFGFTYDQLDGYLRGTEIPDQPIVTAIETMHSRGMHKANINIPQYHYTTETSRSLR